MLNPFYKKGLKPRMSKKWKEDYNKIAYGLSDNNLTKKNMKIHKSLGSSIDPNKIALTFKSVAVGVIPLIVGITGMFGVTIDLGDLTTLVDSIANAIVGVFGAISLIGVVIGGIRKILVKINT
jgi:hypothetical protein